MVGDLQTILPQSLDMTGRRRCAQCICGDRAGTARRTWIGAEARCLQGTRSAASGSHAGGRRSRHDCPAICHRICRHFCGRARARTKPPSMRASAGCGQLFSSICISFRAFPTAILSASTALPLPRKRKRKPSKFSNALKSLKDGKEREKVLLAFDAQLKADGINPGTSADLTVATLFAFTSTWSCILAR